MPSKSKKQAKTMRAACKNAEFAKKVGISQEVACEFLQADEKKKKGRLKERAKKGFKHG